MQLSELSVNELVNLVMALEYERDHLMRVVSRSICGDVHEGRSCQLARGHNGDHLWALPDVDLVVRWPRSSEDCTLGE